MKPIEKRQRPQRRCLLEYSGRSISSAPGCIAMKRVRGGVKETTSPASGNQPAAVRRWSLTTFRFERMV